mmetsp:Transcript_59171/g.139513  ORF Transcript_59171/g.139513 Transcript_59171/m.139513 type:complete len:291 (-) Transcript_59171:59-931(-)
MLSRAKAQTPASSRAARPASPGVRPAANIAATAGRAPSSGATSPASAAKPMISRRLVSGPVSPSRRSRARFITAANSGRTMQVNAAGAASRPTGSALRSNSSGNPHPSSRPAITRGSSQALSRHSAATPSPASNSATNRSAAVAAPAGWGRRNQGGKADAASDQAARPPPTSPSSAASPTGCSRIQARRSWIRRGRGATVVERGAASLSELSEPRVAARVSKPESLPKCSPTAQALQSLPRRAAWNSESVRRGMAGISWPRRDLPPRRNPGQTVEDSVTKATGPRFMEVP